MTTTDLTPRAMKASLTMALVETASLSDTSRMISRMRRSPSGPSFMEEAVQL